MSQVLFHQIDSGKLLWINTNFRQYTKGKAELLEFKDTSYT